ncbi:protein Wiz-like isoform X2 [Corvus hawaiiensis]|uniref:protein Wiz-like isoform X2 n=1 Tax=Corvus hawaiiensis TaxID=134902 RepID=UPI002019C5B9|nr:protein Wiz-like isoform X2 [Corvus hawaiiensis]
MEGSSFPQRVWKGGRSETRGPFGGTGGVAVARERSRHGTGSASPQPGLFSHFLLVFSLLSRRFFRQSLATGSTPPSPECRRRVLFRATPQHRRGMEKSVPDFSERHGDGGRALLMPPEPNPETFPALERPQGEERRAAFLQDAKKAPENPALSGTETELEEDAFYGVEELAAMSREGKGPELREEPDFFSSLARQEPDVALEAHDEADEPDAALSGAVPAAAHRTQLGPTAEEQPEFPKALYRPELRSVAVAGAASWDAGAGEGIEESTLERLPGSKDSTEFLEPQVVTAVRVEPEPLDSDQEDPHTGKAAPESPDARAAAPEEKYPPNEPKHLGGLGTEHPEQSRRGIQRLEWISRAPRSPSPPFRDLHQAPDVAAGSAFRAPAGRDAAPAFRKSLLAKGKPSESSRRKAPEPDLAELGPVPPSEWALPKAGVQLDVGKQSWTVNAEDSVERLLPEPAPCGAFEVEVRPYVCGVLLEEPEKAEELEREENPAVFTCIECSIYFRKKEHLLEHTLQHSRGAERGADAPAGQGRLCCGECGWAFGEPAALERHKRLHQESREKIIEEIQKLNEFPDEGREARLQCPKCVFGTNSSKIFVQHAKMHVKERKDHASKSSNLFGETRESPGHGLYKPFHGAELPAAPAAGKALSACVLCGFPAPNEHILKEHMRYAHSHFSWEPQLYEDDPNQPGTSRDSYSPLSRPGRFSDAEFFGKTERFFPPPTRESSARYDPAAAAFGPAPARLPDRSNGAGRKDSQGFHARKAAPYSAPHKALGFAAFPPAKAHSHLALQQLRKRAAAQQLEADGDHLRGHPLAPEEPRHKWPAAGGAEDETEPARGGAAAAGAVPQAALDLKRTFGAILKATEPAVASAEQQQQLRMMVPVVVLEEMNPHPKAAKRPRGKPLKKKPVPPLPVPAPPRDFLMEEPLPLDVLLLDAPLEGPLELDDLLDSEATMLKNEERKCPYCPDRFHNGIGLANHVRGHLNRVGVSYNVRHFISAEEVKAIEQKFSFQKKKKKVANFDPSTFSLMRCEFCGAGFDTRAGLSSHARAHLRDFGITNWELTISPINILKELLANSSEQPALLRAALAAGPPSPGGERGAGMGSPAASPPGPFPTAWGDEALQPYRDVLAPDEDDLVAMEVTSPPPIPKKSAGNAPLEPPPPPPRDQALPGAPRQQSRAPGFQSPQPDHVRGVRRLLPSPNRGLGESRIPRDQLPTSPPSSSPSDIGFIPFFLYFFPIFPFLSPFFQPPA